MYIELLDKKHLESILDYKKEMLKTNSSFDGCGGLEKYDDINEWYEKQKMYEDINKCPKGFAADRKFVCVDNGEVIGILSYRSPIEGIKILEEYGGHIGYSVKPSRRRQGVATFQLKEMLKIVKEEKKEPRVMITCHPDNIASKKTIIKCGGVYQDTNEYEGEKVLRYWVTI